MCIAAIDCGGSAIKFDIADEQGSLTDTGGRPTGAKQGGGNGCHHVVDLL